MKRISIAFLSLFLCVASVWSMPRPEYPRPQFERAGWVNLNGEWTCSFDFGGSGMEREFYKSKGFDKKITVPFCPESKLSGIGYTDFISGISVRSRSRRNGTERTFCLISVRSTINRKSISTVFWLTAISVGLPRLPWILLLW